MVERSFNSISVDGDTSTNDTVLLFSNGASRIKYRELSSQAQEQFNQVLQAQFQSLARQVVSDGEGASKMIQIKISGAKSESEARLLGKAIANSPLVKTAFFGNDPNWGRVLAVLGSQKASLDPEKVDVWFCGVKVLEQGQPCRFNKEQLCKEMRGRELCLDVNLHLGKTAWTFWTCDLTYDYVRINAEYHT
jgi:glutamate N-acetyltransferase/amino-acid N-acetyltransferase